MKKIICKKHGKEAKEIVLPTYEYVPGMALQNVKAYECPVGKELIFTPEQVEKTESRHDIKKHKFADAYFTHLEL
ncbi:hypothetical protein HY989_04545 [Candidatus Micrarchaeota archaeon]|nr:hypothetical protein [Candidatus Micrarchaeota archaeon]